MDVTPLVRSDAKIIQSYANGGFKISAHRYEGAVCVSIDAVTPWQQVSGKTAADLNIDDFADLIARAGDIDVILLGTGVNMQLLAARQRMQLKQAGLNVEVMDTGAACRTYNVLIADGRRVVAALLPA